MIPIPNLETLASLITLTLPFALILLFLLPAFIEIKRHGDAGPRRILDEERVEQGHPHMVSSVLSNVLQNMENEESTEHGTIIMKLLNILNSIPNAEMKGTY